jgi:hypothetical protein
VLVDTFINTLVKKNFGKKLVPRLKEYSLTINVPNKLQCSTVVFMKVSGSEPISLTSLQPEQSLITLFYCRVAPLFVYF